MMQKLRVWGILLAILMGSAGCYYVVPVQEAPPPPSPPYPAQAAPAAPSPPHPYVGPTDPQRGSR
jgi:hypothetical protein